MLDSACISISSSHLEIATCLRLCGHCYRTNLVEVSWPGLQLTTTKVFLPCFPCRHDCTVSIHVFLFVGGKRSCFICCNSRDSAGHIVIVSRLECPRTPMIARVTVGNRLYHFGFHFLSSLQQLSLFPLHSHYTCSSRRHFRFWRM